MKLQTAGSRVTTPWQGHELTMDERMRLSDFYDEHSMEARRWKAGRIGL